MDFVAEAEFDMDAKKKKFGPTAQRMRSSTQHWLNQGIGVDKANRIMEFVDLCVESADVHSSEAAAYVIFLVILLGSALFIHEPHVGIFYMIGAAFQVLGLILLKVKVLRDKKADGVSCYALAALALSTAFRVRAMLGGAYIPMDMLGGTIYIAMQIAIMFQIFLTLGICIKFGRAKEAVSAQAMAGVAALLFVLAYLMHPDLDEVWDHLNIMWCYGKYLEAIDMWPYLALAVENGQMESFSVHFIVCMFLSRIFVGFVFFTCYHEFGYQGNLASGYALFLSHIVQLVILADFIVHYIRNMMENAKEVLEDGLFVNF